MCNATECRVAMIGMILQSERDAEQVNTILSQYSSYIVGRMGLPYRSRGVNIISVVVDAPNDVISALCGKLGMIPGGNVKALYAKTK